MVDLWRIPVHRDPPSAIYGRHAHGMGHFPATGDAGAHSRWLVRAGSNAIHLLHLDVLGGGPGLNTVHALMMSLLVLHLHVHVQMLMSVDSLILDLVGYTAD